MGAAPRSRSLHVLTIAPFYPRLGDESGGCFVAEPLGELVSAGMQATIFAVEPFYRPRATASGQAPPARWFRYPAIPGNAGLASAGDGLYLCLRKAVQDLHTRSPIDLIHAHGALPCGLAALQLSRQLGLPYVVTVHGLDAFSQAQVGGRRGRRCAERSQQVYGGARRVIGVSQHVCDEVQKGMSEPVKLSVVYNVVNPSLFQPGEGAASPALLTVGNLIPVKGHELVVRALAALRDEFPRITWDVVGVGPELNRIREVAARLGALDAIHFHGKLGRREVAEAFRRCTVFVLPSHYEGFGCVYLEAMASGKVAIGCAGQGIEEVIHHGENGWLVPPDGHAELIEGLRILLRDPERRMRIGVEARKTIVESYTLRHQAEQLLRVYEESVG